MADMEVTPKRPQWVLELPPCRTPPEAALGSHHQPAGHPPRGMGYGLFRLRVMGLLLWLPLGLSVSQKKPSQGKAWAALWQLLLQPESPFGAG